MKKVELTECLTVTENVIEEIVSNLKEQGYLSKEKNTMPETFIKLLKVNVDNKKLNNKKFREFVRNSLPIV